MKPPYTTLGHRGDGGEDWLRCPMCYKDLLMVEVAQRGYKEGAEMSCLYCGQQLTVTYPPWEKRDPKKRLEAAQRKETR